MTETEASSRLITRLLRWALLPAVLLLGIFHVEAVVKAQVTAAANKQQEAVVRQASSLRGQLEYALNSTVLLSRSLVAFVRAVDEPTDQQIEHALSTVYASDKIIRNIGYAPDNIIQHIYPLAGNESALGLNYRNHPAQWPSVDFAMRSRESYLAGPVELVQGGRAVINRTPVFNKDGSYWGIISIAVDMDDLLAKSGLGRFDNELAVSLRNELPDGTPGPWLAGELHGEKADPVTMRVPVPGSEWILFVRPSGGWSDFADLALRIRLTHYGVLVLLLIVLGLLLRRQDRARHLIGQMQQMNLELSHQKEALEYLSRFDPLTNVANRRYFDEVLAREWSTCLRNGLNLSVLVIDIDHFKDINDTHGYALGDQCLSRVAQLITACLQRSDDFLARMGGEEFVVLAPGADLEQAMGLAEKIRRTISGTLIEPKGNPDRAFRLTASIGVATYQPGESGTAAEYCRRADQALYAAKQAGRNRVQHFSRLGM